MSITRAVFVRDERRQRWGDCPCERCSAIQ
jgi:hypothetical protein